MSNQSRLRSSQWLVFVHKELGKMELSGQVQDRKLVEAVADQLYGYNKEVGVFSPPQEKIVEVVAPKVAPVVVEGLPLDVGKIHGMIEPFDKDFLLELPSGWRYIRHGERAGESRFIGSSKFDRLVGSARPGEKLIAGTGDVWQLSRLSGFESDLMVSSESHVGHQSEVPRFKKILLSEVYGHCCMIQSVTNLLEAFLHFGLTEKQQSDCFDAWEVAKHRLPKGYWRFLHPQEEYGVEAMYWSDYTKTWCLVGGSNMTALIESDYLKESGRLMLIVPCSREQGLFVPSVKP